jgi:hypothetical protein
VPKDEYKKVKGETETEVIRGIARRLKETKRKNRRKQSRNKTEDRQQEAMNEEGYRRPERMMTFPDPSAEHNQYDRRPLMPMPLPGFAGVPFFTGRDATEFLERFDELCDEYGLT